MKKFVSMVLVLAMMLAMSVSVMANPGQNPNQNPGGPQMTIGNVTVTVTGGGNNLVILATNNLTGEALSVPREGNGTFNQNLDVFGHTFTIHVQGNSLRRITPSPELGGDLTAHCRYRAYVKVWNDIWLANGGNADNPVGAILSREGGLAHFNALLAAYGATTLPNYFHFIVGQRALYNYWADRLEVGLLLVGETEESLAAAVRRYGNGNWIGR